MERSGGAERKKTRGRRDTEKREREKQQEREWRVEWRGGKLKGNVRMRGGGRGL